METAALILGIIGGVWGLIYGIAIAAIGSLIGGVSGLFGVSAGGGIKGIGVAILLLSICAIVGGGISRRNTKTGGILLLIGSVGMIILTAGVQAAGFGVSWETIVPMLLLIIGGVLALIASRKAIAT